MIAHDTEDESNEDKNEKYPCKNVWTILLEEYLAEGVDMLESLKQCIQFINCYHLL